MVIKKVFLLGLFAAGMSLLGCASARVGSSAPVPKNAGQTCQNHCKEIGMTLSAVAIMANNVGCVCEPRSKSTQLGKEAASSAGGMATVLLQQQEEDRRRRQQDREQQRRQSNY